MVPGEGPLRPHPDGPRSWPGWTGCQAWYTGYGQDWAWTPLPQDIVACGTGAELSMRATVGDTQGRSCFGCPYRAAGYTAGLWTRQWE